MAYCVPLDHLRETDAYLPSLKDVVGLTSLFGWTPHLSDFSLGTPASISQFPALVLCVLGW